MIAYIYDKYSFQIENKINNITSVSEGKIVGDNTAIFGSGSDYIILQSDIINLSIGDVIYIAEIQDCRDYFLKGSDYWYQEQIKNSNETINNQNDLVNSLIEMVITTTLPII